MPDDRDAIAIVGGGPAGLAAAELLGAAGRAVTVYERMPSVARKLLIAGRGGLNITHSEARAEFLARYHPRGALDAAIAAFPPDALRAWCADLGEPTFVGSSGRVFPRSFKASPLLRAWLGRLDRLGVRIRTRHRLTGIAEGLRFETPDGPLDLRPRATLLALGGASWPRLGSDGRWVPLLEGLGVAVAPLRPANAGFVGRTWKHVAVLASAGSRSGTARRPSRSGRPPRTRSRSSRTRWRRTTARVISSTIPGTPAAIRTKRTKPTSSSSLGAVPLGLPLGGVALMIPCAGLAALGLTRLAHAKIGGQTGDVIGACQQVAEIAALLALVTATAGVAD
ncbi:adenosylcobinamide-GDP ribazoletransferase [Methylobacterium oryzae]|uniref:adenosylcobinamide-GDP ribazoletransferase n=1 Tax=Methylobacterium oryzae TaxID=334852 RepID=UPI002F3610D6